MRQILVAAEWSDWEDELFRHCYPPGDELTTIRTRYRGSYKALGGVFAWFRYLKLAFDIFRTEDEFDVVIVWQQTVAFFLGVLHQFSRRHRPPIVLMGFNRSEKYRLASRVIGRAFIAVLLSSIERIVCYSHRERDFVIREFGQRADKVFFIPFGMDFPFDPRGTEKEYIFAAGDYGRDYKTLLGAAKLLSFPFKIAVTPKLLRGFALPENVELIETTDWRDLAFELGSAKAVVIPLREREKHAGQNLLLLAMHMGKAVVATKSQVTEGYIESGRNGFLVEGGSSQRLALALQRVIDDEAARRRLEKAAVEDAGSMFCSIRFWRDVAAVVDGVVPDLRAIVDAA